MPASFSTSSPFTLQDIRMDVIEKEGLKAGLFTKDDVNLFNQALAKPLKARLPSMAYKKLSAFKNAFDHGMPRTELHMHISMLVRHIKVLHLNLLNQAEFSQKWDVRDGWHPWLNRMVTLGNPDAPRRIAGLHPCTLTILDVAELRDWISWERQTQPSESYGSQHHWTFPTDDNSSVSFMEQAKGALQYLYRTEDPFSTFTQTITPGAHGIHTVAISLRNDGDGAFAAEELEAQGRIWEKNNPLCLLQVTYPLLENSRAA